jgi:serine/threonine protein kinase
MVRLPLQHSSPSSSLRPEFACDRYALLECLGQGSTGEVWSAVHLALDRPVAIKFLKPECLNQGNTRRRLLAEARALAAVASQHVVGVLDLGETASGIPFMVMERLLGSNLRDLLKANQGLPLRQAVALLLGAAEGVHAAHATGVVHRDLKPENLFVCQSPDGQWLCKILDFGVAKHATGDNLTQEGALIGTVRYMAPEQARGESVDARTDVYALGLILYEAIAGRSWFEGKANTELLFQIMNPAGPDSRQPMLEIPTALRGVIMRTLATNPDQRFQSAREFAEGLRAVPLFNVQDEQSPELLRYADTEESLDHHETVTDAARPVRSATDAGTEHVLPSATLPELPFKRTPRSVGWLIGVASIAAWGAFQLTTHQDVGGQSASAQPLLPRGAPVSAASITPQALPQALDVKQMAAAPAAKFELGSAVQAAIKTPKDPGPHTQAHGKGHNHTLAAPSPASSNALGAAKELSRSPQPVQEIPSHYAQDNPYAVSPPPADSRP